jgi:hypothetical protein
MKKLLVLVLFAIFGFGFTGIEKTSAQDFKFIVEWDASNCNCGTPVDVEIYYHVEDLYSTDEWTDIEYPTENPWTIECDGVGTPKSDCEDCYRVEVTVYYKVGGVTCCTGTTIVLVDGDELLSGVYTVYVTMN